jgi:hypothetical protein
MNLALILDRASGMAIDPTNTGPKKVTKPLRIAAIPVLVPSSADDSPILALLHSPIAASVPLRIRVDPRG